MCYDIKTNLEKQLRRAILDGDPAQIEEIREKLSIFSPDQIELNHASGFEHPSLIIYTNDEPFRPELAQWGLTPHWVKDKAQQHALWNKTLNARGETIWEKPSFRYAAEHQRCLVFLEGFYEHQHYKGKTYPYYIARRDHGLLPVAGLWSKWTDPDNGREIKTFTIVTTRANTLMSEIHNNPKLEEPRMPLILPDELKEQWIMNIDEASDKELVKELILPYPDNELEAHTVGKLRGKGAIGNTPEATKEVQYAEIIERDTPKLF